MCKKRDIILIDSYKSQGADVSKHSFVVIDDKGDTIRGLSYDFVCNVLSSFKSPDQRRRKMSYPGNFEVTAKDMSVPKGNTKDGYIKADQFYYFQKDTIEYRVIGSMDQSVFNDLIDFIENSDFEIELITDNLM